MCVGDQCRLYSEYLLKPQVFPTLGYPKIKEKGNNFLEKIMSKTLVKKHS